MFFITKYTEDMISKVFDLKEGVIVERTKINV